MMNEPPFALLFPGQGSQRVGMGEALCTESPSAAKTFAQADEVLGMPLSRLCFEGPSEKLNHTVNTQPAILTVSVAALRAFWDQVEAKPAFVAGHSLGEFSALVAAGALSFPEALRLVRERGRLMDEAGARSPGGMAAVLGLEVSDVEAICAQVRRTTDGYVGIANDNCPGQVVISGEEGPLQAGMEAAREDGARRVIRLKVSIAAHSPLMAQAAETFRDALDEVDIRSPEIPFVANATGGPLKDASQIRAALERQLTSPIRWTDSMRWMIDQGVVRFIELEPGKVLTGLLRRIDRSVEGLTVTEVLT